jgi:type VI secretion system VgrG family protein
MSEQIRFSFVLADSQPDEVFSVLRFEGDEGISRLYEFNIELLSDNADIDIDRVLQQPATLILQQGDDQRRIQGVVSHFDAVRKVNNQILYRARLVPRLWELSLYHTNEVYLQMTVPEIIEAVLAEAGFETVDYDLTGLQGEYKAWPYKCQYGESHLDFISRLMERDGIYYYFCAGDAGEKLIFCDQMMLQEYLPAPVVRYSAESSLEINALTNAVQSFVCQQQRLPYKVILKDYNDDKPSVDIKGEAVIDDSANKSSEIYVWGQNIETPEEGEQLAQIRAEQIRAGKQRFHGESTVCRLVPGYFFTMQNHFRSACNQDYCLINLHHEGSDRRLVDGGSGSQAVAYRNELTALPADVQYRPPLQTRKPEIHGILNAYVDAEGDGKYAEIDAEGRYRILLPFDRVDRDGGKASHWIRMSQPFAGENQGMHFPLRKGTEVLLSFVGGDPDRPVISGSMPNAAAPSIINSENNTNSMIRTAAGNKIEIEDQEGKNRIKLETPEMGTYMHLGAPNHPGDGWVLVTDGIERKFIGGGQQSTTVTSLETSPADKDATDIYAFAKRKNDGSLNGTLAYYDAAAEMKGEFIIRREKGNRLYYGEGNEFNYGEGNIFSYGNSQEVTHWNQKTDTGARDLVDTMKGYKVANVLVYEGNPDAANRAVDGTEQTYKANAAAKRSVVQGSGIWSLFAGLWLQEDNHARSYFDAIIADSQTSYDMTAAIESLGNLKNDFAGRTIYSETFHDAYHKKYGDRHTRKQLSDALLIAKSQITGYLAQVIDYCGAQKTYKLCKEAADWVYLMGKGEVELKQTNTFTAQNGNIYDFGGYWNYNLGNSYAENYISQNTNINKIVGKDRAPAGGPNFTGTINGSLVTGLTSGGTWISKSYGDSYSYTKGKSLEIIEGDSESRNYGNSYSINDGNTEEENTGNTKSTTHGRTDEFFMGGTSSFKLSGEFEMCLSASLAIKAGTETGISMINSNSIFLGLSIGVSVGPKLDVSTGSKFTADTTVECNTKVTNVDNTLTDLVNAVNTLGVAVNSISNESVAIVNCGISLEGGGLKMIS